MELGVSVSIAPDAERLRRAREKWPHCINVGPAVSSLTVGGQGCSEAAPCDLHAAILALMEEEYERGLDASPRQIEEYRAAKVQP